MSPGDPSERLRILCVSAEQDTYELMKYQLGIGEYEVSWADTTESALEVMTRDAFDLVVLDNWYIGDGHGIELCRRIRQVDATTPILFYSANVVPADIRKALEAGAQAYLPLPDLDWRFPGQVKDLVRTAAAKSVTARFEEIRAIREQLESQLDLIKADLARAGEILREAQLQVIHTRAQLAFMKAGGTRANFKRLWQGAWNEATGRMSKTSPSPGPESRPSAARAR
jgi:DNA-binding response OmpR family regulator